MQALQFFFDITKMFLKHRNNKQNVSLDVHYKGIKMILMRLVLASSFNFQITLLRYNSHSAKYIFLKYRSQVIVVTELSKHLYLISGYFHYPKRRHHTHQQLLPIFLSSQSQAFKNLWICLFWIFHINGRIPYVVFCDGLLSLTIIILQYSDTSHSYSILIVECHKLFLVYFFGRVGS